MTLDKGYNTQSSNCLWRKHLRVHLLTTNRLYTCSALQKKKKKSPRDVIVLKVFPANPMGGDELCREFTQPFNLGKIFTEELWVENTSGNTHKPLFTGKILTSEEGQAAISCNDFCWWKHTCGKTPTYRLVCCVTKSQHTTGCRGVSCGHTWKQSPTLIAILTTCESKHCD